MGVWVLTPCFIHLSIEPNPRAGSIDGKRVGLVDHFAYSASKAAVHRLTKVRTGMEG